MPKKSIYYLLLIFFFFNMIVPNYKIYAMEKAMIPFLLTSPAFNNGGPIPKKYSCKWLGGQSISPHIVWHYASQEPDSFALFVEDESNQRGDIATIHWTVFNIPSSIYQFVDGENISAIDVVAEGTNYTGTIGYVGPCPPSRHTYKFTVFALKSGMPLIPEGGSLNKKQFRYQYEEFILNETSLIGYFQPSATRLFFNKIKKTISNLIHK